MHQSKTILGVCRGTRYSPNHIGNDFAIFKAVTDRLETLGYKVQTCTESQFVEEKRSADLIFNMARDPLAIERLQSLEREGINVVNSAYGIRNCIRKPMTELLVKNKIAHPKTWILSTDQPDLSVIDFPCWFKRGDSHAILKEDVSFIQNMNEARLLLLSFRSRGIPSVVINKHLEGDLIKFYGVAGTDFFYWFYPTATTHSKFGLEAINGKAKLTPFSVDNLQEECNKIAKVLSVPIYGGDCVVADDGSIKVIDFNDWPSFAKCREESAKSIAECIINKVNEI
jgi:hypothetical protein